MNGQVSVVPEQSSIPKQVVPAPKGTWASWMSGMFPSKKSTPSNNMTQPNITGGKSKKRRYHKKGGWTIQKKKASSKSNTIQKRKTAKIKY